MLPDCTVTKVRIGNNDQEMAQSEINFNSKRDGTKAKLK